MDTDKGLRNWLGHKLRHFLGTSDVREIVDYVMGIENNKDAEEYLKVILIVGIS